MTAIRLMINDDQRSLATLMTSMRLIIVQVTAIRLGINDHQHYLIATVATT
jgi:hypothetical protein